MTFEIHEAADAFPMMEEDRYSELLTDVKVHGLRVPITLCDNKILDGRNRYKVCIELGIDPRTVDFDGDPWAYVWSLNGQRRDLVADQRYLIWKHCHEHSEAYLSEKRRIQEEANTKRSEAAEKRERSNGGAFRPSGKPVVQQSVGTLVDKNKSQSAKASLAKVNMGAVARGDRLANVRPDLAEKVRKGEVKPAEAYREMKRDEIIQKVESIEATEVKEAKGLYDVIVIDPPWPMQKIERDVRPNQVLFDYPTMEETELEELEIPAVDDSHLWLWTTHKFLPMAFRLLDSWEFRYVCTFVWHKPGGFQPIGLPQYNCEFALYARRGSPKFIDTKTFNVCFDAKRGGHSEKPDEFYDVVRRVTAGRRIDMFNRRPIEGFDSWGQEAKK